MTVSIWEGKSWATLGDSITAANAFQPIVNRVLGFARVYNYAQSGCPMTAGGDRDYGATVHTAQKLDSGIDCVTVFAGINDFRLGKPIGDVGTRDIYTFKGAYATLIETVLASNPGCRLNLWTPLQRDKDGYDMHSVNETGHRLIDYVEAVRKLGQAYSLPVLDLYAESGFNKLTLPLLTSDGLHPNNAGYQRIASMAINFLERL